MKADVERAHTIAGGQRVTIVDLASALGLTKGTVSRALNDYPDIAETTRLRVRKAAEQLGYRPLSNAQAIRTGRVRAVGLVLQLSEHDRHRPFLADFLAGVSETASGADWTLTVTTATDDSDALRLLAKLAAERKADGFIVPRTYLVDPRIQFLREAKIPFVLYGRTGDDDECAWFDIESERATREAVDRLADLGHRRIGFIQGGVGYTYSRLRLDGYRQGLAAAGITPDERLIAPPSETRQSGKRAALELLSEPEPPTAIVCAVDRAALGVYEAARTFGLEIGTDISVTSYDGIPEGELMTPPLSTFAVDTRNAGSRLTEMLIRRVAGEPCGALRALGQARFLDRGSNGPPTKSPAEIAAHIQRQSVKPEEYDDLHQQASG